MEPIRHEPRTWYFCDPEKNTGCPKTICASNPENAGRKCVCVTTDKKEYAKLDENGEPCVNHEATQWSLELSRRLQR